MKKAHFLYILLCLVPLNMLAQTGSNCNDPIPLIWSDTCRIQETIQQREQWYTFTTDSSFIRFALGNHLGNDSMVQAIEFYEGDCSTLTQLYYDTTFGAGIEGRLAGLNASTTYYIRLVLADANFATISWCFLQGNPMFSGGCPVFSTPCELVCNGDFEYYSTGFYMTDIWVASPWNAFTGTSDYYNSTGFLDASVSVPTNAVGDEQPYTGQGYAGLATYWTASLDYREYIVQQLTSPLLVGQSYLVEFWVSLADSSTYASKKIGALFTNVLPTQSANLSNINAVPQVVDNNYITNKTGWTKISGIVTGNGEQYITIGQFENDANSAHQYQGPTGYYTNMAYYYIDQVSVIPYDTLSVITTNTICDNTPISLFASSSGNPLNTYVWYPANLFTNNTTQTVTTTLPAGNYGINCIMFMNGYPTCPIGEFITITVNPSAMATAGPDVSICPGQPTLLNGIASGTYSGTSWSVLNGPQLCANCSTTTVNPQQTTSYVFAAFNGHTGCHDYDTLTVTVYPAPQATIIAPPNLTTCSGTFQFQLQGGVPPNSTVTWTSSGTPASASGASITTGFNGSGQNGLVVVTVTNQYGCVATDSVIIPGCCSQIGWANLINDSITHLRALYPAMFTTYQNTNAIVGINFVINGTLVIDTNTYFRAEQIKLGPSAKIIIRPGKKLFISQAHLYACSDMWDGIYLDGTNTATELVVIDGSSIQDAINAIYSTNGGKFTIDGGTAQNNAPIKFNKNRTAILVKPFAGIHPGTMRNAIIACDNLNAGVGANIYTFAGNNMRAPYNGILSEYGFKLENSGTLTIGDTTNFGYKNKFRKLRYGVHSTSTNVTVWNADFYRMNPLMLQGPSGCAVYAAATIFNTRSLRVGAPGTANAGVNMNRCTYGVRAQTNVHATVENCTMDTMSTGISIWNCKYKTLHIRKNTIKNFSIGINLSHTNGSQIEISDNNLNIVGPQTPNTFAMTGILISNAALSYSGNCSIHHNTIRRIRNGIVVSRVYRPKIFNNTPITFYPNQPLTVAAPGVGIKLEGCVDARVANNLIENKIAGNGLPPPTLHAKLFGIYVYSCTNDSVYKNTCKKTGTGIFLKGADNPSFIACNTLDSCAYGINFGFVNAMPAVPVSINDQLRWNNVVPTPTGNIWTNNTWDLIGAIDINNPINWYRNNSYTINYNMPFSLINNQPINLVAVTDNCSLILPVQTETTRRDYILAGVCLQARTYDTLNESFQYHDRVVAYRLLRQNPHWLSLGTPNDAAYQTWFANATASNLGTLADAEDALDAGNPQAAMAKLNVIVPDNHPEANRLSLLQVYIDSWALDQEVLSSSQKTILEPIAEEEYPVSGGLWVFDARNMLGLEINDSTQARFAFLPVETTTPQIQIYPNPTNQQVTIRYDKVQEDTRMIELYDLSGRLETTFTKTGETERDEVDLSMLNAGVYFIRIYCNGEIVATERIVIIRN
jgi:parallel beta-helix repeat protein